MLKNSKNLIDQMIKLKKDDKAKNLSRFFKTDKGEYGEGDLFLGISVLDTRKMIKNYAHLDTKEISKLLTNKYHEIRLIGLLVLVRRYQKSNKAEQKEIFNFYLKNTNYINNWDLVDLSAYHIVGDYLLNKNRKILYKLAKSKNIWERRIAVVSTYTFIKNRENHDIFELTKMLLNDKQDLIHKACGWMLRESGKSVSEKDLEIFLEENYHKMPRTMLRYAIEKFSDPKRQHFLKK